MDDKVVMVFILFFNGFSLGFVIFLNSFSKKIKEKVFTFLVAT